MGSAAMVGCAGIEWREYSTGVVRRAFRESGDQATRKALDGDVSADSVASAVHGPGERGRPKGISKKRAQAKGKIRRHKMARVEERATIGLHITEACGKKCGAPAPLAKARPLDNDVAGWPDWTDREQEAGPAEPGRTLRGKTLLGRFAGRGLSGRIGKLLRRCFVGRF